MVANQSSDPIYSVPYEEKSSTEPDGLAWGLDSTSVPGSFHAVPDSSAVPNSVPTFPSTSETFPSTAETFSGQTESNLAYRKDFNA